MYFGYEVLEPLTVTTNEELILLVDDNRPYREAVKRNLEFIGYAVQEAEDLDSALVQLRRNRPMLIITDLDMRTHTEGLDLIRTVKEQFPRIPVILISAVGTFDEGALARELGALYVISKSRIDEEIENLYQCLDDIKDMLRRLRNIREKVEAYLFGEAQITREAILQELEQSIADPGVDTGLKSDLFDMMNQIQSAEREKEVKAELEKLGGIPAGPNFAALQANLKKAIPKWDQLHEESRSMMETAEIFKTIEESDSTLSVSRNVGFSYCFAVENEIKQRIGRKIARFLSGKQFVTFLLQLYDTSLGNLDLHFTQYLMISKQIRQDDLNLDIIRQVIERMNKHRDRYKPDGLKALGVVLFCYGRNHKFKTSKETVHIENPLGLKGLDDNDVTALASALIRLQHFRNPYIHPEFSEHEKTDRLREVALESLALASQLG